MGGVKGMKGSRALALSGQRFGMLTVVDGLSPRVRPDGKTDGRWLCRCDCGNEKTVLTQALTSGHIKSCGCLRRTRGAHNRKDLSGQVFGRLTAVKKLPSRDQYGTVVGYWLCRCSCGKETEVPTGNLTSGGTKSCGCLKLDDLSSSPHGLRHGYTGTPTWRSWFTMRKRCRDMDNPNYGGRGIAVDPRWDSFENFLTDMGERPSGMTLDRINTDGPYTLANCRWANNITQSNNRRVHRHITCDGRTQTLAQWSREVGINSVTIHCRLKRGWDVEEALFTPVDGFHPFSRGRHG